uniref:Uncharacterized protein n=1 Tax=Plectus sambesii TaxID=2011161 RepID=A0A914XDN5_9BILA
MSYLQLWIALVICASICLAQPASSEEQDFFLRNHLGEGDANIKYKRLLSYGPPDDDARLALKYWPIHKRPSSHNSIVPSYDLASDN